MHCLSTDLVFLLHLLHPKHFWFPEVQERTELANGSEGDESSCGLESKARRAARLGRDVNPLLRIPSLWPIVCTSGISRCLQIIFSNATLVPLSIKEEVPLLWERG